MTKKRIDLELVTVNGRVIALGGPDDTVEELDMEKRTWTRLPMKLKRNRMFGFKATVMERSLLCN